VGLGRQMRAAESVALPLACDCDCDGVEAGMGSV
jgi:hypothetical protein